MLNKLQKIRDQKSDQKGFTIIEVMIVLAIAGLILLIVFLAVPALQRNSRNTQRKTDVANTAAEVNNYVSNNSGKLPTAVADFSGNVKYGYYDSATAGNINYATAVPASLPAANATNVEKIFVYGKAECSGNTVQAATSTRKGAIYYFVEAAGATPTAQCQEI